MKYIFGASGHGLVILDILQSTGNHPDAFIDDLPKQKSVGGIPVFTSSSMYIKPADELVIAVGDNITRKKLAEKYKNVYYSAIHQSAILSQTSSVNIGTVVMAGVVLNPIVLVGAHCIINTKATIDHECVIEDFVHISPSATLCGNVYVGTGTHIGACSVITQNVKVGKWAVIGAGSVVIRDVPDYAIVVGNPARIIKYNDRF